MTITDPFDATLVAASSVQMNHPATPHHLMDRRPALSGREIEVLMAWLKAESKTDAAKALFITSATVNTHLTRIRAKYAATGRPARSKANLFARAIQDGYTTLDDW